MKKEYTFIDTETKESGVQDKDALVDSVAEMIAQDLLRRQEDFLLYNK